MLKVVACVILFVLVVEGFGLNTIRSKVQTSRKIEEPRSIAHKRAICPNINVQCGRPNDDCATATGTEPCVECLTNATICAFNAATDTDKCKCYTDGLACINSFVATYPSCGLYGFGLYSTFATQFSLTCGNVPVTNYVLCELGASCNNGTCKLVQKSGPCTSDADCGDSTDPFGNTIYTCNGAGQCVVATGYASVGDPCTTDSNCANTPDVTCKNNVCVGLAQDATCFGTVDCDFNFFCSPTTNKCTPRVAAGADCPVELWGSQDPCLVVDNICSVGKCIKLFSKQAGASCNSSDECDFTLICDQPTHTCRTGYPDLPCNVSADCPNNATYTSVCNCGIDGKSATCVKTQTPMAEGAACVSTTIPALAACLVKNNCRPSFIPGSCARTKCLNELGCYHNCQSTSALYPAGCAAAQASCSSGTGTGSGSGTTGKSAAVSVEICMWLALALVVLAAVY